MLTLGSLDLLVRLASGGVANVFLVRDNARQHARLLALKVLHPGLAIDEEFTKMFFAEAQIASRLRHPNIVSIAGFGEVEGVHCLSMEFVFGESLAQVLRRATKVQKPLSVAVLLRILSHVMRGLDYAHALGDPSGAPMGIVHRDVTPQNIMVGFNGVAKLTDFGIAKASNRGWETTAGIVKGKFAYMSPEQALGKKVDRRSDVFGVGIVLWEALTGKELFAGMTPLQVLDAIQSQPILPPSQVSNGLSPIVDALVMKALERAPSKRYQTAGEMSDAIDKLIASVGVTVEEEHVSRALAEIFGDVIAERALVLRAAMAGHVDEEALAAALDADILEQAQIPEPNYGYESETIENTAPQNSGHFQPHPPEQTTATSQRPTLVPARLDPAFTGQMPVPIFEDLLDDVEVTQAQVSFTADLAEVVSLEADIDLEVDIDIVGFDASSREDVGNDALLEALSEDDVTHRRLPAAFTGRFGDTLTVPTGRLAPVTTEDGGETGFDDVKTV